MLYSIPELFKRDISLSDIDVLVAAGVLVQVWKSGKVNYRDVKNHFQQGR